MVEWRVMWRQEQGEVKGMVMRVEGGVGDAGTIEPCGTMPF
jgi:hypothetical protein